MTNETKHTPTPWTTGYLGRHILCANDRLVGKLYSKEDAAHIVKCVNMHDELVEALIRMKQWCEDEVGAELPCSSINTAIAKARGEV